MMLSASLPISVTCTLLTAANASEHSLRGCCCVKSFPPKSRHNAQATETQLHRFYRNYIEIGLPQQIPRLGHLASFLRRSYPTCNFQTSPCKKQARIYPAPSNSIQLRLYRPPQSYKSLGFQPRWKRGCFLFIILFPVSIPVLQHNKHSVNIY